MAGGRHFRKQKWSREVKSRVEDVSAWTSWKAERITGSGVALLQMLEVQCAEWDLTILVHARLVIHALLPRRDPAHVIEGGQMCIQQKSAHEN